MDQWQGIFVGIVCLLVTAGVSRWARRWFDRRNARKRHASLPAASRQVRRAQARKRQL